MKLLIQNAVLVNPLGPSGRLDILVEGQRVRAIAPHIDPPEGCRVFDAAGLTALPGLIDMHCHLREPGYEYKETIYSGTHAAAKGGITAVCCMPNTQPVADNAAVVEFIRKQARLSGAAKVYPIGAITMGLEGKLLAPYAEMLEAGAVAFSDDGNPVASAQRMRTALEYAKGFDALLISHCEDKALTNKGSMNEGFCSTLLGLRGITRAAEEVMLSREIILAEALQTKVHIAHVSTRGGVEMIRAAKARGVRVTAETCPHYFTLTDEAALSFDPNTKVSPPLRTKEDRAAIIEGLKDGTLDCIVTDHAPHNVDDKNVEFELAANGISGFETSFALAYDRLVAAGHITIEQLARLMSANPARVLGVEGGVVEVGRLADITLVDEKARQTVCARQFVSKGKNTPFDGMQLQGVVRATVVDGEMVYQAQ